MWISGKKHNQKNMVYDCLNWQPPEELLQKERKVKGSELLQFTMRLIMILCLLLIVFYAYPLLKKSSELNISVETPATINRIFTEKDDSNNDRYYVEVDYITNEGLIEPKIISVSNKFYESTIPGKSVKLYYIKNDPKNVFFYDLDDITNKIFLAIAGFVFYLLLNYQYILSSSAKMFRIGKPIKGLVADIKTVGTVNFYQKLKIYYEINGKPYITTVKNYDLKKDKNYKNGQAVTLIIDPKSEKKNKHRLLPYPGKYFEII